MFISETNGCERPDHNRLKFKLALVRHDGPGAVLSRLSFI